MLWVPWGSIDFTYKRHHEELLFPTMGPRVITGMNTHVGVYVRQSDRRETGSEASTATQREACLHYIDRMPEPPAHVEHYEDLGISAFKNVERPDYHRLLDDARRGRINVIMVHYTSRLSRKTAMETLDELRPLLVNGVRIVSVGENREFHADNLFALMELLFKLQASHEESLNKSLAVKAAKDLEASLGGYTGKPPFGFSLIRETRYSVTGKPVVVKLLAQEPDESTAIVRAVEIAEEFIENNDASGSLWKIARKMNQENVRTRGMLSGKETANSIWDSRTVKRVLRDPRIAGFKVESIYGTRADGAPSNKVAEYRIIRDSDGNPVQAHPSIISPERWFRIQEWLDGRHPGGPHTAAPAGLLSAMRLLYCACGAIMTHGGTGSKKHYRCRRRRVLASQHAGEVTIGAKGLEDYVARRVFVVISSAEDERTLAVMAAAAARYARQRECAEAPEVKQERDRLLAERAKVRRAREQHNGDKRRIMLSGGFLDDFARDEWEATEQALAKCMYSIDTRLSAIGEALAVDLPLAEWIPAGIDPISRGSWWDSANREEKRAFVRLFLDRIEVRKAWRHAGQSVPAEKRVRLTWAGGINLDDMAEAPAA